MEVLFAMVVVGIVIAANMAAINFSQNQSYRNKELGTMTDLGIHYLELLKSLPFSDVTAGAPINALYDGAGGAPNIRIPSTGDWQNINTLDYQVLHPDLVWLTNRAPQMRVILTTASVAGQPHTKHLKLDFRWEAPFHTGQNQALSMNLIRVKDL